MSVWILETCFCGKRSGSLSTEPLRRVYSVILENIAESQSAKDGICTDITILVPQVADAEIAFAQSFKFTTRDTRWQTQEVWQLPSSGKGTYGVISPAFAVEDWRFTDGETRWWSGVAELFGDDCAARMALKEY